MRGEERRGKKRRESRGELEERMRRERRGELEERMRRERRGEEKRRRGVKIAVETREKR